MLEYIQWVIKDQRCDLCVETKRKPDDSEEWIMAANQPTN